jgi:hypothetical protein
VEEVRQDRSTLVLYEPSASSLPASRQSELERRIRSEVWSHMSPDLAHAAGLTLPELIDWVSGIGRLSALQTTAIAMKMGLIPAAPKTGIDAIRTRLIGLMKQRPADFVILLEWRGGEQALRDFVEGEPGTGLTIQELDHLAEYFWGKGVSLDPQTALLRRPVSSEPTSMGRPPDRWTGGSNAGLGDRTPGVIYPPPLFPRPVDAVDTPARFSSPGWA